MYIVDGQQEREGPWQGWYGPGRWTGHAMKENDEGVPTTRAQGGGNFTQHPPLPSLPTPCLMRSPPFKPSRQWRGMDCLGAVNGLTGKRG